MNRLKKCMLDMINTFYQYNYKLLTINDIKKYIQGYSESELYNTLKFLYEQNIINRQSLAHKTFFWLKVGI